MAYTSVLTWSGTPTAAQFNQQLRDNFKALRALRDSRWLGTDDFYASGLSKQLVGSAGGNLQVSSWLFPDGANTNGVTANCRFVRPPTLMTAYFVPSTTGAGTSAVLTFQITGIAEASQIDQAHDVNTVLNIVDPVVDALTTVEIPDYSVFLHFNTLRVRIGRLGSSDTYSGNLHFLGLSCAFD